MSAAGHVPPPFFKRGPAPLARLFFFVALSVLLLVADLRFHALEWLRMTASTVAYPLQLAAYLPVEGAGDLGKYFSSLATLHRENDALRHRQLVEANLLLRQRYLEDENKRLRALLDMKEHQPVNGVIADIQYAARDPFSRRVVINKGLQEGIEAGQAVIDELGVIGQVTRVLPLTAEVTLLTDKNQMIPVEVQRNGLRAILAGAGSNGMELRFLASNAEVQVGDILVTSGLDGIYLRGLPVARVAAIDRDSAFMFARIRCVPLAGVERHGQVLVLGRPPQVSKLTEENAEPGRKKIVGAPHRKRK
ncbi:Cell shape-determining protein MreC [Georgfuchsia toluolica]|uniref:Cell shape-determining protein MreC n=1 Tax=Georgfuchsia toluolica TaxID=424218 RepID=A0A916J6H4_9PROT|nr:rod shape-determining protein MreC [Georgfuchsia toluolica]CAG4884825.1 Cell shape-determining protein MreC [Georgfuchsia toluolica]